MPRCLMMMVPVVTRSPSKRFTPSRLDLESRPLRELPPAFFMGHYLLPPLRASSFLYSVAQRCHRAPLRPRPPVEPPPRLGAPLRSRPRAHPFDASPITSSSSSSWDVVQPSFPTALAIGLVQPILQDLAYGLLRDLCLGLAAQGYGDLVLNCYLKVGFNLRLSPHRPNMMAVMASLV